MSMIVVFGATGSTGVPLVRRLVSEGRAVRAAVRDVAKARGLLGDGVELVRADLERPATLPGALEGAAAVYCAVGGPTGTTDLVAAERALIDAARAARVGRYVKVSGIDASPEGPARIQRWHGEAERHLEASGLPFTVLRPNFFMQNLLGLAPAIAAGVLPLPIGDARGALIDARDIADVAAVVLTSTTARTSAARSREGPRDPRPWRGMRFTSLIAAALAGLSCTDTLTVPPQSCSDAGRLQLPAISDAGALPRFSFFVTSQRALGALSGCTQGFGGDLRYGETGPGAGLRGADTLCALIAERAMPGASAKRWRAFLSAADGGDGRPVNAIDRVGEGPWYDRLGRVVANTRAELANARPTGAHAAIVNDLPNEDGVPNHAPDPSVGAVDNHHMLTGSDASGRLASATATCLDWTSARGAPATEGKPRVGLSWPRGSGGRGGTSGSHWISAMDESGCAPAFSTVESGGPDESVPTVGSGGGYGGFYCFALTP